MTNPNADIHAADRIAELERELAGAREDHNSMRDFHTASMKELYRILNIDGSDGEYRFKWVACEAMKLQRELAAKNAVVEALRKDKSDLKAAMEHYAEQVYRIVGGCK
jgi:hypothetical protein